ncbi:MAG TPA: HAD hydrolase-like protein [Ktedonobacteraceae bacterium]|nr:HAD hydrolase-like protein [Ktedonobacteraceae bacterium]
MNIPLFDIDWTLLAGGSKLHRDLLDQTFNTVYGVANASIQEIEPNGMITTQVIIEVLRLHEITEECALERMAEAIKAIENYFVEHEEEDECLLMPGAYELLSELKERHVPLGLLTGNVEGVAWRRITKAGLREFFDFGAFGDLAYKRVDLIPIARQRAREQCNIDAPLADFVIIGDSPLDVACAKAMGISSIAVGAGVFSSEALMATEADLVVGSLQERQKILSFLKLA